MQKEQIEKFFKEKKIAVAGASRNSKKFGYQVLINLIQKGFETLPLNPYAAEINGIKCYNNIEDLPNDVKNIVIVTPKKETAKIVKNAINKGITNIWIQQLSETEEAVKIATKNNINLITGKCIFMFTEPVKGIHKFHRNIKKLFGILYN